MLTSPSRSRVPEQNPVPVPGISPRSSRRRIWPLFVVLLAAAALSAGVWTPQAQRPTTEPITPADRTAKVIRGVLERTLRLTGTVTTKNFASVSAPMMQGPDAGRDLLLIHIAP